MQICYLQQCESLSHCPLHFEGMRSNLEKTELDLWETDYEASIHLLGIHCSGPADFPKAGG